MQDFLHKISRYYADRYDIIVLFLERLCTPNLVRNHRVAKHILDSGWRTFKQSLKYKAKMVLEVNSKNTPIDCSKCGNKVLKPSQLRCTDVTGATLLSIGTIMQVEISKTERLAIVANAGTAGSYACRDCMGVYEAGRAHA